MQTYESSYSYGPEAEELPDEIPGNRKKPVKWRHSVISMIGKNMGDPIFKSNIMCQIANESYIIYSGASTCQRRSINTSSAIGCGFPKPVLGNQTVLY